ncbi:hypothetical protein P0F65_09765 [Sphingomonas sp. I4]
MCLRSPIDATHARFRSGLVTYLTDWPDRLAASSGVGMGPVGILGKIAPPGGGRFVASRLSFRKLARAQFAVFAHSGGYPSLAQAAAAALATTRILSSVAAREMAR